MEENLEISKSLLTMQSKFFLSLSLSPKRKRKAETLSLFTFEVSLFRPKKVRFERTNREREVMICSRRFVSLFKKCFSLVVGVVGFLKKKSDEFNFHLNSRLKKKQRKKKFRIYSKLSHENNTTVNEEAQNAFLLTRAALTTNTILILTL
tara:strand:+ start:167 stop:616 length:450 start_codon:yes stop_codon:yes gene_type:complete